MRNTLFRFVSFVAFPLLAALFGVYLMTFDLLDRVSVDANKADRDRSAQLAQSVIVMVQSRLKSMVEDNSLWDDAVRNTSIAFDKDWVEDTWGVLSGVGSNYDYFALVDRSRLEALTSYTGGVETMVSVDQYFNGQLGLFLDKFPAPLADHMTLSGLIKSEKGIAAIAAAPIMPTSSDVAFDPGRPLMFVMAKTLSPDYVAELGQQHVVDGLTLVPPVVDGSAILLQGPDDQPIAGLQWTDRKPGDVAFASVSGKTYMSLGFLSLVIAGTIGLCWWLFDHIAEREAASRHAAYHDPLTGLKNRAALAEAFSRLQEKQNEPIALAYADLDGFKDVNDTYDHQAGDDLIRLIASGMSHLACKGAFISRLGGDEFVAMFTGRNALGQAELFSQRLIGSLKDPIDLNGRFAKVGASVGIASGETRAMTFAEAMRQADVAMYEAKRTGKNRICFYAASLDAARDVENQVVSALRSFIAAQSMELAYQPIVRADTHAIAAVEVLARWPKGSVPFFTPDQFIPIAERNGLMDELGELILSTACTEIASWGDIRASINMSPVQLRNPATVPRALDIIRRSGIDPRRIEFEITENALVDDFDKAQAQIAELRNAGVMVALDDFGSGYSSVGYLRKMSFDRIKIDRSIVSQIFEGKREQAIAHGTIVMANGMAAEVTAEGIETSEQASILRLAGCNELQGYFFHRPLPAADLRLLMGAGSRCVRKTG